MRSAAVAAAVACSLVLAGAGCKKGGGAPTDPGMDASTDAEVDASTDAAVDAEVDAAVDASADAATDAGDDGGMCADGLEPCPTGCANLDTDDANCGACGLACTPPAACAGGLCL